MNPNNFLFFQNKKEKITTPLIEKIDSIQDTEIYLNIYEIELKKLNAKIDSLIILAEKIKSENEKTNSVMTKQEDNIKNIDTLIQKQINIIHQLSEDINIYKSNLDTSMENFESNKEKLLHMVKFIKEMKNYILNIEHSSNNMKDKSDSILNISKTIKNISSNSKLLSINAQIEASKISDKNNGFGVISNEMVKMADSTKENSALIDKTINNIMNDIDILNQNIKLNTHKIEDSIKLCEIIVDFVEELTNEYKSNITMFNGILDSMDKIAQLITKINDSILDDYKIANDIFRNTSTEYMTIESFIEQANYCKKETIISSEIKNTKITVLENEILKLITESHRDFDFEPLNILYDDENALCKNIYESLFKENITGTITPVLAKGWNDENSKIWTIYLKNDIYFSNGEKLTAEDVAFSIMRTSVKGYSMPENTFDIIEGHTIFNSVKDIENVKIKGIEVINDTELKITLKREDLLFLNRLSFGNLFIISKKEFLRNNKIIGTGAYQIASIKHISNTDTLLKLKVNEYNYACSPYIKEIDIYLLKNYFERLDTIFDEYPDLDMIYPLPFLKKDIVKNIPNSHIASDISYACLSANFIGTSKNKIIHNKDFRQSVFSIINNLNFDINDTKDYFIKNNMLTTYWIENNTHIRKWLDDTPILKNLSGQLNIVTYNSFVTKTICEKIKNALEPLGLTVKIHIDSFESTLDTFDLVVGIFNHDSFDIYSQLLDSISPPIGSYILDSELGQKLQSLTTIPNYKEKNDLLKEIEFEILNEYYNLPLGYTKKYVLKKKNIVTLSQESIANLTFDNILKNID